MRDRGDDGVEVVELSSPGSAPSPEPVAPPVRAHHGRGRVLAVAAVALVLIAGLAVVLLRSPATTAPRSRGLDLSALGRAFPSDQRLDRDGRGFSCDDPGQCEAATGTTPTPGVVAALAEYFPGAGSVVSQRFVQITNRKVRSQYVTATLAGGVRLSVATTYDGESYSTPVSSRTETSGVPTYIYARHTVQGWSVSVSVGGVAAAGHFRAAARRLVVDTRLVS